MSRAGLQPLLSAERVADRVRELGAAIDQDFPDSSRPLWLVAALKGAAFFLADLARAIEREVRLDFLQAASYGSSTASSGQVRIDRDPHPGIAGADVLLVEDIVDSGRTANALLLRLRALSPASVGVATLLDKPSRRVEPVEIRYKGLRSTTCLSSGTA